MKRMLLFSVLGLFIFFFVFVNKAAAFSFNITSVNTTTISSGDQEVEINLSITDLPSESYFRVALQKSSGGPYFGYVQNNNGDWKVINPLSGDCTGYYNVSDTSITSLVLKFKAGSDILIDNGNYNLKAHRFTKTCTSNKKAINDYTVTFNLTISTSTPIPNTPTSPPSTPTEAFTPTSKPPTFTPKPPTSTPKSPTVILRATAIPSPTSKPTSTPTPKKSSTVVAQVAKREEDIGPTSVLGIAQEEKPSPTPSQEKNNTTNYLPFILIGIGIVFIAGFGILIYHPFGLLKQEE